MLSPKITTDRTVDTSSLDAIIADVISPAMSDEEKALALWHWLSTAIYHYGWPYVRPQLEENWEDPIKIINVHGYGLCGTYGRVLGRLFTRVFGEGSARLIGLTEAEPGAWHLTEHPGAFVDTARLRDYPRMEYAGHSTAEVNYGGRWRLLDPHVRFLAYLRGEGGIAGAEDLIADPTLVTDPERRLDGLMPCGDLSRVFYASAFTDWGLVDRAAAPDDHRMEIALRRGEVYTRYWDRKGPFCWFGEMDRRWDPDYLAPGPRHLCEGEAAWQHYGNGELVYRPDFADGSYREGMLEERGLGDPNPQGLMGAASGRAARVVFTVQVPYLLVEGRLELELTRRTGSDRIAVWVRPSGGVWKLVWQEVSCGRLRRTLDLSPWMAGKYGYELRLDLKGARAVEHAVVHELRLRSAFVLNYLALPRLLPGCNQITVTGAEVGTLRNERLEVTYAWCDREGEHEDRRMISVLPETYEIEIAPVTTTPSGNPKYMRLLRMQLK